MQQAALIEIVTSKIPKEAILERLTAHDIEPLLELATSEVFPANWRAAWLLQSLISKEALNPTIIDRLILSVSGKTDGHQRELLKLIMIGQCSDEQEGQLFDLCATIWESPGKQPSVRSFAFKIIMQIAKKHPELISELNYLMQAHYLETLSPGIRRSIEKQFQILSAKKI